MSDTSSSISQSPAAMPSTGMDKQPTAFDKRRVRRAFDRAANNYDQHAVLQKEVANRLLEKLDIVRLTPAAILDAGCGTGNAAQGLASRYRGAQLVGLDLSVEMLKHCAGRKPAVKMDAVCADLEQLPFADNSFDLVFSSLSLQWTNTLDKAFTEFWRVLKPGGLCVFSSFGPDTLKELRLSWASVDEAEHVNTFTDMHDVGDLLLQTGFAEPVMESEIFTLTYTSVDEVMHDLKNIGANVKPGPAPGQQHRGLNGEQGSYSGLGGRHRLEQLRQAYEAFREGGVLPASFEITYGHAWKFVDDRTRKVEFSR